MNPINLPNRIIGDGAPPFLIAELSANHNRDLDHVLKTIDAAASSGADAIKLQTYTADTMTINHRGPGFIISEEGSLWRGRTLYDLYSEGSLPWDWHQDIFDYCSLKGLICFSTPFDETAVDFLEGIGSPMYKVASFEITDVPLLRSIGSTKKPVIMSTGMASAREIEAALNTLEHAGCSEIVLLKCTSAYPAPFSDINLLALGELRNVFGRPVGLSDHSLGLGVSIASVALGACVIERHFTLDRMVKTLDSDFSLEPDELKSLSCQINQVWQALGAAKLDCAPSETSSKVYRRSIYAVRDISKGEKFSPGNIRVIRPGLGADPVHLDDFLAGTSNSNITRGTPLNLSHICSDPSEELL